MPQSATHLVHTGASLAIALLVVYVAASLGGLLAGMARQPKVVGEIAAGIALGPTILGTVRGDLQHRIFTPSVTHGLSVLAQAGIVIFICIVAAELQTAPRALSVRRLAALSLPAFAIPFVLAVGVSLLLVAEGSNGAHTLTSSLFIGVALSITALPVLARILAELRLESTGLGSLAIASAALLDVFAWSALSIVVATSGLANIWLLPLKLSLLATYAFGMYYFVKPSLSRLWDRTHRLPERPGQAINFAVLSLGLAASSWATQTLGLHVVFGAFMFGLCIPRRAVTADFTQNWAVRLSRNLLLPAFFALAGQAVSVSTLSNGGTVILFTVLLTAIIGKMCGAALGARLSGFNLREMYVFAVLFNTRGLTELIVVQIGWQTGLIGGSMYTALVLTALITTAMTRPLLSLPGIIGAFSSASDPTSSGATAPSPPVRQSGNAA